MSGRAGVVANRSDALLARENVPSCSGVIFGPFIDAAAQIARKIAAATQCGTGCSPQPMVEIGAQSSCDGGTVKVDYQALGPCR